MLRREAEAISRLHISSIDSIKGLFILTKVYKNAELYGCCIGISDISSAYSPLDLKKK